MKISEQIKSLKNDLEKIKFGVGLECYVGKNGSYWGVTEKNGDSIRFNNCARNKLNLIVVEFVKEHSEEIIMMLMDEMKKDCQEQIKDVIVEIAAIP